MSGEGDLVRHILSWSNNDGSFGQLDIYTPGEAENLRLTNAVVDGMRRAGYDVTVREVREAVRIR